MMRNMNRIRNNNAQVARQQERLENIVAPLATGLAERAVLQGLGGDTTGLFPPTQQGEELNIESFQSRRNRDRTGLDSRLDIQENIQTTQDSTAQAREFLEQNRLRREERAARRDSELRRVRGEMMRGSPNLRDIDNERNLRQQFGKAQTDAEAVETVRPTKKKNLRIMGEDEAIQALQRNPDIPREGAGDIGASADMADALDEGGIPDLPGEEAEDLPASQPYDNP